MQTALNVALVLVGLWGLAVVALAFGMRSVSSMRHPPDVERWTLDAMPDASKELMTAAIEDLAPLGFVPRDGMTFRYGRTRESTYLHFAREGSTFAILQLSSIEGTTRVWLLFFSCDERCREIVTAPSSPDPSAMAAAPEPGVFLRIPDVDPAEALIFHERACAALLGKDGGRCPEDVLGYVRDHQDARVALMLASGWERGPKGLRPTWRNALAFAAWMLPPLRFLATRIVTTRAERLFADGMAGSFDGCRRIFDEVVAKRSARA